MKNFIIFILLYPFLSFGQDYNIIKPNGGENIGFNYNIEWDFTIDSVLNIEHNQNNGVPSEDTNSILRIYNINFNVYDINNKPLNDVKIIIGDKILFTNDMGIATFDTINNLYIYTTIFENYISTSDIFEVKNNNLDIDIYLQPDPM